MHIFYTPHIGTTLELPEDESRHCVRVLRLAEGTEIRLMDGKGTFYRAASPEAQAFVKVGDHIAPDTVIGIIEAMKVMNEIKAEKSGVIKEVLVENGQPVEFGQPLFVIE